MEKGGLSLPVILISLVIVIIALSIGKGFIKDQTKINLNLPTQTQIDEVWDTYRNLQYKYEFSYPPSWVWLYPPEIADIHNALQYKDPSKSTGFLYSITPGYISREQLETMGIDYCSANPTDERCEVIVIADVAVGIDWGDQDDRAALAEIPHPEGGVVILSLTPNSPEAREQFLPILKTFKFTAN